MSRLPDTECCSKLVVLVCHICTGCLSACTGCLSKLCQHARQSLLPVSMSLESLPRLWQIQFGEGQLGLQLASLPAAACGIYTGGGGVVAVSAAGSCMAPKCCSPHNQFARSCNSCSSTCSTPCIHTAQTSLMLWGSMFTRPSSTSQQGAVSMTWPTMWSVASVKDVSSAMGAPCSSANPWGLV